jgi:hypothetical protein
MATFAPPSHRVPQFFPGARPLPEAKLAPKPATTGVVLHALATASLAALAAAPAGVVLAAMFRAVALP